MSGVPLAAAPAPEAAGATAAMRPTRVRHVVLWLTVLAYMITYMDRVIESLQQVTRVPRSSNPAC